MPARLPIGRENAWILYNSVPSSDARAIDLAGPPPSFEETFARAARWAVDAGHLTRRQAEKLVAT